jgi:hypothetical protein
MEAGTTFERLIGERTEPERYAALIATSRHNPEVEASLSVLKGLYERRHQTYIEYLRSNKNLGGTESRSPRWRECDTRLFGGVEVMAALLGAIYPSPTGQPPIQETMDLVRARVGPLCNGWPDGNSRLTHHPHVSCEVHPPTRKAQS